MAAVSDATAIALGGAASLAQASQAPAAAPQAVSVTQQAEAQQAARALLASPFAVSLSAAERTEMTKIASGEVSAASKGSSRLVDRSEGAPADCIFSAGATM
ncbi:hypothetical protein, partial [Streptomyces sp. WG5]|uniref:hypothetical protein n=1 Tax=Streptomyces sp. WG5 TaxID=3417648 RepID=UPI003CEE251C